MSSFIPYSKTFTLGSSLTELSLGLGSRDSLAVTNAVYTNTSGSSVTVNLSVADDGGVAATGNSFEVNKALSAYQDAGSSLIGANVLPGAKVYGGANTAGVVNLKISGYVSAQVPKVW